MNNAKPNTTMPLTPEQKRLSRQKKKQKILDDVARLGKLLIQLAPTQSNLRTPLKPELLGTAMDHGGHQRALNFPDNVDSLVGKVGDLSIGMVCDGHWKELSKIAGKGIKPRCNKSEKFLEFLKVVKEMLIPLLHRKKRWDNLDSLIDSSLRVTVLLGASTLPHTDSYRGNTPNCVYISKTQNEEPGFLVYATFPKFKSSVVTIDGQHYVPHSYSDAGNEVR